MNFFQNFFFTWVSKHHILILLYLLSLVAHQLLSCCCMWMIKSWLGITMMWYNLWLLNWHKSLTSRIWAFYIFFHGLQIEYQSQGWFVHQTKYVKELLQKANMVDCKPCLIPFHPNKKLFNHGSPPVLDLVAYRSLVGDLKYLTFTWPDIGFTVN